MYVPGWGLIVSNGSDKTFLLVRIINRTFKSYKGRDDIILYKLKSSRPLVNLSLIWECFAGGDGKLKINLSLIFCGLNSHLQKFLCDNSDVALILKILIKSSWLCNKS